MRTEAHTSRRAAHDWAIIIRSSAPTRLRQGVWGEAASKIAEVVNDELFRSLEGKSKHALWLELCDIVTRHPREVEHLKVEAIIRAGIRKFTDEVR